MTTTTTRLHLGVGAIFALFFVSMFTFAASNAFAAPGGKDAPPEPLTLDTAKLIPGTDKAGRAVSVNDPKTGKLAGTLEESQGVFVYSSSKTNAPIPDVKERPAYLSPESLAADTARNLVYTALNTAKAIVVTNYDDEVVVKRIELKQSPNIIILSPDATTLYASTGTAQGSVEIFAVPEGAHKASIPVGHTPCGLVLSADGKWLYVANRFNNNIGVIDLAQNKMVATIPVVREPRVMRLSPDGNTLAVGNFLPAQAANSLPVAAVVSLIDTQKRVVRAEAVLENGAQSILGLEVSPDGRFFYASHTLSRYTVPVTQLSQGWVNTSALCFINADKGDVYATVLLDDPDNGAANSGAIRLGGDGKLYIVLSGTHELMVLDLPAVEKRLAGFFAGRIKVRDVNKKSDLSNALSFTASYKKRIALKGRVPRDVVWIGGTGPDAERRLLVCSRFSTALDRVTISQDKNNRATVRTISIGSEPEPDSIRRGEFAFADASICMQQWQSCVSCHPDGRMDGLNWDQINDGMGNPKQTKSLLFSHFTPPVMITGIRPDAEYAVRTGIQHTLFTRQPESLAQDIDEYLRSMRPIESPHLAEYRAKDPTGRGKAIFEKASCSACHEGTYYTDMQLHDLGTCVENMQVTNAKGRATGQMVSRPLDTPTLREVWRTAPYLYDGRAATLREVFTKYNKDDVHGTTSTLTQEELDLLILYVNTL